MSFSVAVGLTFSTVIASEPDEWIPSLSSVVMLIVRSSVPSA